MKQTTTHNYRLAQAATLLAALAAAGLLGWAIALALGVWGDAQMAKLAPWRPFALQEVSLGSAAQAAVAPAAAGTAKLVGVAGSHAYFMTGNAGASRSLSLAVGDALPSGEKIVRIERDAVVVTAAGQESRLTVFGIRAQSTKIAPAATPSSALAANCRLTGADRASAIFIETNMARALTAERATFARMFAPDGGSGGGIRAKGTGGTTAMFAILDGDLLLKADGVPIKSSDAIISDVLARVERGNSVVVEGERNGAPRRWVYAPAGCAVRP